MINIINVSENKIRTILDIKTNCGETDGAREIYCLECN